MGQIYNPSYKFRGEKKGVHENESEGIFGTAAEIKNGRAPSGMTEEFDLVDFLTTRDEAQRIFEYKSRSTMAMHSALPSMILPFSV